jgi:hypothetical protein
MEAGTLPKLEFFINDRFDEEYFAEVREKRLANLLAQEVTQHLNLLMDLLIR